MILLSEFFYAICCGSDLRVMTSQGQPDAQVYRNRTLMNFNDLCLIYAYTQADGRYSRSSHDVDFEDDAGMNFGVFF